MSLDSSAVFFDRVTELRMGQLIPTFKAQGWDTTANFAFATSYVPGGDVAALEAEVFKPIFDAHPNQMNLKPAVGRLFIESATLATADLRRKVEGTNEDA